VSSTKSGSFFNEGETSMAADEELWPESFLTDFMGFLKEESFK
jgi:hypothetical protein